MLTFQDLDPAWGSGRNRLLVVGYPKPNELTDWLRRIHNDSEFSSSIPLEATEIAGIGEGEKPSEDEPNIREKIPPPPQ